MEKVKLDLTDRKILAELDKNCRISNSALAKKVNKLEGRRGGHRG